MAIITQVGNRLVREHDNEIIWVEPLETVPVFTTEGKGIPVFLGHP